MEGITSTTFTSEEFQRIADILEATIPLVELNGGCHELVAEFVAALDNSDMIVCDELP